MVFSVLRISPEIQRELNAAACGAGLSEAAAKTLITAEGPALEALMAAAAALRDKRTGKIITYSRKVFIPLTNLCRDVCGYCTFVRQPKDPLAHTMEADEVSATILAGEKAGCKEALFSLGDKPELKYASYRAWLQKRGCTSTAQYVHKMCAATLQQTALLPHINAGALSDEDFDMLRPVSVSMGMMLEGVSPALMARGGAHRGSPDKDPQLRLGVIESAGKKRIPFTTGILIGIGEQPEERVDALLALKKIQDIYGHIQEIIVQNFRTKADIRMRLQPEPSEDDMIRAIAITRLLFGESVSVQAPPNLMFTKRETGAPLGYQRYLQAGLNDWGGVSPVTKDFINPERAWPQLQLLREDMHACGFILRERLGIYPEYIFRKDIFLDAGLRQRVSDLVDETGLVRNEKEMWEI